MSRLKRRFRIWRFLFFIVAGGWAVQNIELVDPGWQLDIAEESVLQVHEAKEQVANYAGDTVWVVGRVQKSNFVLGQGWYQLHDLNPEQTVFLLVFTRDYPASDGATVEVRGVLHPAFKIRNREVTVLRSVEFRPYAPKVDSPEPTEEEPTVVYGPSGTVSF